jgi:hypothetical protein
MDVGEEMKNKIKCLDCIHMKECVTFKCYFRVYEKANNCLAYNIPMDKLEEMDNELPSEKRNR